MEEGLSIYNLLRIILHMWIIQPTWIITLCFAITFITLAWFSESLPIWGLFIGLLALHFNGTTDLASIPFWALYVIVIMFFSNKKLRERYITSHIMHFISNAKMLPTVSETEDIALHSGSTWVDRDLFSGNPDFKAMLKHSYPNLTAEEQEFLDKDTEELCELINDWEIYQRRDLTPEIWNFLKERKFFGIIIPKQYGGLGFTALAHSSIIAKIASRSQVAAITAMVPNSLGPAELLLHYGTQEQRDYYLPRLADGREIPCFGLTEPLAGSDAASITSSGVVIRRTDGSLAIKLNINKRYITLGAVSTVIGLAFQLQDPDNLLEKNEIDIGITCALIPSNSDGIILGRRHDPLGVPFFNSPIQGNNVVIGIDQVIGGVSGVGQGWRMLMECLAAGRGISLPATSTGGAKLITRITSAYAMTRQQFGVPIAKFEGIEEKLARIFGFTYMLEAARIYTAGAIDDGERPAVINAIAKYHFTEKFREIINDGMDILGGAAICRGPKNLLAHPYMGTPIAITVEGANVVTRCLMHFGQGLVRAHPFAYTEMMALKHNNLSAFDSSFFSHIKHLLRNAARSIALGITRGYLYIPHFKLQRKSRKYLRKLSWASASFAFLADIALVRFGGSIKTKEKISGRFGDVVSHLYLATATIRRFEASGGRKDEEVALDWTMHYCLNQIDQAMAAIYSNMGGIFMRTLLKPFLFCSRLNSLSTRGAVNDSLDKKLVISVIHDKVLRNRLAGDIFIPSNQDEQLNKLERGLALALATENTITKIKRAIKATELPKARIETLIEKALNLEIINDNEARMLNEFYNLTEDIVQVDSFLIEEYNKAR